jgi:hypothetical protein
MRQKQVGRMTPQGIAVGPAYESLQESTNCKSAAKRVKATQPVEAGKASLFEGEIEFSEALEHTAQMCLEGKFVQGPDYNVATCFSCASTAVSRGQLFFQGRRI